MLIPALHEMTAPGAGRYDTAIAGEPDGGSRKLRLST